MKNYNISEKYLDELIEISSRTLVGKVCKRFEIISDLVTLKKEVKELLYEAYRDLKEKIIVYNLGIESLHIKFETPKGEKPEGDSFCKEGKEE